MKANNGHAPSARVLVLLAPALLLVACGVLPKREPTAIFEPARAAPVQHPDWPTANWSLLVAKPVGGGMLDNDRIVVRPAAGELTVYKATAWADPTPELVQNALLRRFEDSGKILSVSRPGAGVRGEFQLQTDVRAFESVYTAPNRPEVQVEIYARLVHTADGEVVAARSFRETQTPSGEEIGSVVDAFSAALGRATDQIAGWTLQAGNSHK
ncbi:MAG: ABC-type transport auxiliary lipoprotein family protein [Arenimonas sp.]